MVRSYKGYWVDRYPPPSPVSQARLAKRPMMAALSTGAAGASGGGYSQAIDVSSLTPNDKTTIKLPYGAVGNTYALTFNLTGCGATDKFSWTVTNDPTGRAAIAPSGGPTVLFSLADLSNSDAGHQLQVTVQLTKTSAAPPVSYTLLFQIVVIQCDPISLAPRVLMPVTVGTAYTQNLVAHGAHGNFTWSVTPSLPPGLMWDDDSKQLSGTVTDATQVGKAFNFVIVLAAPDVVMDSLTVSLGITLQSAPAVASGMDPWERILIGSMTASGVVMAALAAFALNRYKAAKANAKTAEAAKTGNTSVENATNGDPKSVSKSIIKVENTTVPVVERNIPYNQSLIDGISQAQKDLSTQIEADQAIVSKLGQYLQEHKRDNTDAAVTDDDLLKDGYETYEDVVFGRDAVLGLGDLRKSVASKMERLSEVTQWSNQIQTKTVADQNKVLETANSESNTGALADE
jgi:cell division protein FtsN